MILKRDWDWLRPHALNLCEYVGIDPVNAWDPTGFADQSERSADEEIDESIWKRFVKKSKLPESWTTSDILEVMG
ncbi:MAG: hypothetical protein CSA81_12205 [Acidobacteria bacterium]|nr:MAG: hypothetical protein CSA81_12205 [Acidobacteriota bacterium]